LPITAWMGKHTVLLTEKGQMFTEDGEAIARQL
jgi:hypothetical protein